MSEKYNSIGQNVNVKSWEYLSYFSCCFDNIPDNKQKRKDGVICYLVCSNEGSSPL